MVGTVETILRVKDIGFAYEGKEVLRNVSFSVSKGESLMILGPSGTGKTTLLRNGGLCERALS